MTRALEGTRLAELLEKRHQGAARSADARAVWVDSRRVLDVARWLREDPELAFDSLVHVTAVDYIDYFEVVYRLLSLRHNHAAVVKTQVFEREAPTVPSVSSVWKGAELQEREVYDLMGVSFSGHPNLKRIMLWEGFEGHPLRKDFLLQRP